MVFDSEWLRKNTGNYGSFPLQKTLKLLKRGQNVRNFLRESFQKIQEFLISDERTTVEIPGFPVNEFLSRRLSWIQLPWNSMGTIYFTHCRQKTRWKLEMLSFLSWFSKRNRYLRTQIFLIWLAFNQGMLKASSTVPGNCLFLLFLLLVLYLLLKVETCI